MKKYNLRDSSFKSVISFALSCIAMSSIQSFASGEHPRFDNHYMHNQTQSQRDKIEVAYRGDVRQLPQPLRSRLVDLAGRPHSYLPLTVFAEAPSPSILFMYYLLDTKNFQPNVFTAAINGINETAMPTGANFANGGLPTKGAVRVVLEPKLGLPTNPNDPGAFIDMFTDVSGLFVINNEAGWYEGWMISDVKVPQVAAPRLGGGSQFGKITQADVDALKAMGAGNNLPGKFFTFDGNAPRTGSANDQYPDGVRTPNTLAHPVSIGSFNSQQQSDVHAYWEFNHGTNWIFPHYELPFTGGIPGTFAAGLQYNVLSVIPGSGPSGISNNKLVYGDNPNDPRDADRSEATNPAQIEFRNRFIPSALDQEVLLSAFLRPKSFRPDLTDGGQRLLAAFASEVGRVDQNGDGVISHVEADIESFSDGLSNRRLYLSPLAFNRFAITRELNDGLLAPRFAPSQRAYVAAGNLVVVNPGVPASVPQDADNR
jgi:hypothetical protein